jgi:hypothetical protein
VGDYIDRGPENLRTCRIVMAMVEAGSACAVMGNHDFNAVCLNTPDPNNPGTFLRPHTTKNLHQVAATQHEMDEAPEEAALVPEVVFAVLARLYELFEFFQLPKRLVEEELARLQSNRVS